MGASTGPLLQSLSETGWIGMSVAVGGTGEGEGVTGGWVLVGSSLTGVVVGEVGGEGPDGVVVEHAVR